MKKFIISLSIIVIVVCGGYIAYYFASTGGWFEGKDREFTFSWVAHPEATEYNVYIDDDHITTVTNNSVDLTEYMIEDGIYDIEVKAETSGGEVSVYTKDYKYVAKTKGDFKRKTFFMNGKTYDYYIESLSEYETFVWYNLLYRNNSAKFYNACEDINTFNVSNKTVKYINSYPEYHGVYSKSSYAARVEGNVYTLRNLEYYLPKDFTLSVANCTVDDNSSLYNYKQDKTQYLKSTAYNQEYEAAAVASIRTFPIEDEDKQKVKVYNTEQLFMVAQYGASPVLPEGESVVKTVYNNAKTILSEINNSDSLTDYQKALNIYRYICMNVSYDHILFDYMASIDNSYVQSFGMFSSFYIEGVLYDLDNQVAVCDGLAKAYTLMCNIEGIECSKVNGTVEIKEGDTVIGAEEHAWNKIKIGENYHLVDTTWGTASYTSAANNKKYEVLTHRYFLVGSDFLYAWKGTEARQTRHIAKFELSTLEAVDCNYYGNAVIGEGSLLLTSDEDLENMKDYIIAQNLSALEFKLSIDYYSEVVAEYGSISAFVQNIKKGNFFVYSQVIFDNVILIQISRIFG